MRLLLHPLTIVVGTVIAHRPPGHGRRSPEATSTVPVVMAAVGDPVGTGIVPNMARPGGNITGRSAIAPDLEGKRLELLREVVPHLAHVAFFPQSRE